MLSTREVLLGQLVERRNADGGWSVGDHVSSNAECTALACLALRGAPGSDASPRERRAALDAGESWLLARQQASGAWSYSDVGASATWPTPLVLLALLRHAPPRGSVRRGYDWLLAIRGQRFPWRQRVRDFFGSNKVVELDSTLDGWPWTPGAFAWVEPTSWALLALKARWPARPPRAVRRRIGLGERMLADRACPGGGWNYGNSRVMGQDLDPYPDTTAVALLGLHGGSGDVIARGFRALDGLIDADTSGLSLSLALLSHRAWERENPQLVRAWQAHVESQAAVTDTRTLALAAIAAAPRLDGLGVTSHA